MDHSVVLQLEVDDTSELRGRIQRPDGWSKEFRGKLALLAAIEQACDLATRPDP